MVDEFTFQHHGRSFRCCLEAVGASLSGPAQPSNAHWSITVDGVTGHTLAADPRDTEDAVRSRVIEWYNAIGRR